MSSFGDFLSCVCEGKNVNCPYCHGQGQIPLINHISILLKLRETQYYKSLQEFERFDLYEICMSKDDVLPPTISITVKSFNRDINKIKNLSSLELSLRTSNGSVDHSLGSTFTYFLNTLHMLKGSGVMKGKFLFDVVYNGQVESFTNESKGYHLELDERLLFIEYFNLFKRKVKLK